MANQSIKCIGKENCTGCFACSNVCNVKAVNMKLSDEGFYVPEIDESICSDCGACKDVCPVFNYKTNNYNSNKIDVYAAYSTSDNIRLQSSSGGIFSEIGRHIISQGGIVYGARWDSSLNVIHEGIDNPQDLEKLRSSKYVQSKLDDSYRKILKNLENNRKVLFTGTPCQVAALKNFTDSENLFTIDVVCHGIPSKVVFEEYLKYISSGNAVINYNFRDKSLGWSKYMVKAEFKNGSYQCITRQDPFFHGFICDLYSNLPCYSCSFSKLPRPGDITLGDFWGISKDIMDERGISLVLANNEKGKLLLKELQRSDSVTLIPKTLEEAVKGNPRVYNGYLNKRKNRAEILKNIRKSGFKAIYYSFIKDTDRYKPDYE
mgnify:CR=1 FL=1